MLVAFFAFVLLGQTAKAPKKCIHPSPKPHAFWICCTMFPLCSKRLADFPRTTVALQKLKPCKDVKGWGYEPSGWAAAAVVGDPRAGSPTILEASLPQPKPGEASCDCECVDDGKLDQWGLRGAKRDLETLTTPPSLPLHPLTTHRGRSLPRGCPSRMRWRGKPPPFSAAPASSPASVSPLLLLRLPLLVLLLINCSFSISSVAASTMRRQVAAFVQVPARTRSFFSHRPTAPIPSVFQPSPSCPARRVFCCATPTTSSPTATTPPKPAAAMRKLNESLQELQHIADYFPGTIKDNSTAFFHAPQAYATVPLALAAALHISPDRAVKLHEIGAVYIYRKMKFRRTRLIEDFPPASVEEGDLFRVYLFPRRFPECVTDYSSRVVWEDEEVMIVDKPPGCPCSLHVSNALEALDVAASASLGLPLIRWGREGGREGGRGGWVCWGLYIFFKLHISGTSFCFITQGVIDA